jgi:plastocyanin
MSGETLSRTRAARGRRAALLAAAVAAMLAPAASAQQQAAVPPNEVVIDNYEFGPKVLTVKAGSEVVWINKDDEPHTVVADGTRIFKSPPLDMDDKFSFVLKEPGTYAYHCSVHAHMTGTIVVE